MVNVSYSKTQKRWFLINYNHHQGYQRMARGREGIVGMCSHIKYCIRKQTDLREQNPTRPENLPVQTHPRVGNSRS